MILSAAFREQLEVVRGQFLDKMDDVILELDTLVNALADGREIAAVMEAIRFRVHRLAGTASTFGYTAIGELAAQAETEIDLWKRSQVPQPFRHIVETLEKLLDEMEQALDLSLAEPAALGSV